MMDLQDYLVGAQRIIQRYARPQFRQMLLESEEAVNAVAEGMMLADWHWDPQKNTQRKVYRVQRAMWALMDYQKRLRRKPTPTLSLDQAWYEDQETGSPLAAITVDPRDRSPLDRLIAYEESCENHHYVRSLTAGLSPEQRRCVIMHCIYEISLREISEQLGLSYTVTCRLYQSALRTMRQEAGVL
jgi:hypothetical protein